MGDLQRRLDEILPILRSAGSDFADVEVKDASGGFPRTVLDTVSAFANGSGGLVILGLAEPLFAPTGADAAHLASVLASQCSDNLKPSIRPQIELCQVEGQPVVMAEVPELEPGRKPCYVSIKDQSPQAYIRSHDGDRKLTPYEHHAFEALVRPPIDDETPVPGADVADLDAELVENVLRRLRSDRAPVFRAVDDLECLRLLRVLVPLPAEEAAGSSDDGVPGGEAVSLGGLLALGRYPQQFFPRLNVTFVAHVTENGEPLADGTRYLDSQLLEGPVPVILESAEAALRRNMRRSGVVVGLLREDRWDYPIEAIREVVVNALVHRDYHWSAQGQSVRLDLYPDRLEISSPGGLYGAIDPAALLVEPVTSTRNPRLARLLQDVPVRGTNRTIIENVGTGLQVVAEALRREGMAPPHLHYSLSEFRVVMLVGALSDHTTLAWLESVGAAHLSQQQQLGLAHVRRHGSIDNRTYCALTGCEPATASLDLAELRRREFIERRGGRRWAVWQLAARVDDDGPRSLASSARRPVSVPLFDDEGRVVRTSSTGAGSGSGTVLMPGPPTLTRREQQVLETLADGPAAARDLADRFGVTPNAVRNWLRSLENAGLVCTTEPGRRSRFQQWALRDDANCNSVPPDG